ncbi:hypothetical protein [Halalkaliarchaeum desulfuricum]|uniref:hypothetical protein n=1 Tax=Halalkaliarchaeum desulfuricum TaxID=2055893 RepID=UPI0012B5ECEC|nr:hypothetical protein [Halalkaliarchaeum desulfuricum]
MTSSNAFRADDAPRKRTRTDHERTDHERIEYERETTPVPTPVSTTVPTPVSTTGRKR